MVKPVGYALVQRKVQRKVQGKCRGSGKVPILVREH